MKKVYEARPYDGCEGYNTLVDGLFLDKETATKVAGLHGTVVERILYNAYEDYILAKKGKLVTSALKKLTTEEKIALGISY